MLRILFVLGVLCAATLPASAQRYDGAWFKVQMKAKGLRLHAGTEPLPASFKATGWVRFTATGSEGDSVHGYIIETVTEVVPGVFQEVSSDSFQVYGSHEEAVVEAFLGFINPHGAVAGACPLQFKSKLGKDQTLKSASFKSLGCILIASDLDGDGPGAPDDEFLGSAVIKATRVDVAKLPFLPVIALDAHAPSAHAGPTGSEALGHGEFSAR